MAGVMGQRFDEIELVRDDVLEAAPLAPAPAEIAVASPRAPVANRVFAFLTDLSLFAALGLALSPLLPLHASLRETALHEPAAVGALAGFLLLVSLHYSALCWMIWGRTVGAAIFDLRVSGLDGEPVDARRAVRRWLATLLCIATAGIGFIPGMFGARRTLADRMSSTSVGRAILD